MICLSYIKTSKDFIITFVMQIHKDESQEIEQIKLASKANKGRSSAVSISSEDQMTYLSMFKVLNNLRIKHIHSRRRLKTIFFQLSFICQLRLKCQDNWPQIKKQIIEKVFGVEFRQKLERTLQKIQEWELRKAFQEYNPKLLCKAKKPRIKFLLRMFQKKRQSKLLIEPIQKYFSF